MYEQIAVRNLGFNGESWDRYVAMRDGDAYIQENEQRLLILIFLERYHERTRMDCMEAVQWGRYIILVRNRGSIRYLTVNVALHLRAIFGTENDT